MAICQVVLKIRVNRLPVRNCDLDLKSLLDRAYGEAFTRRLRTMGIRDRPISRRSPWQNPYVERLIGTVRRKCLDHVLIFGERHLRRILAFYSSYYNQTRTHLALRKDAPLRRSSKIWNHYGHTNLVRIASSLRADMIFGKDTCCSGRWPHRAQPAPRRFAPSIRPDLISDRDRQDCTTNISERKFSTGTGISGRLPGELSFAL
jgi:hypothetical protein